MLVIALLGPVAVSGLAATGSGDAFTVLKMTRFSERIDAASFDLPALDGRVFDSKSLKGKVVLINFWATWCGPCKEEMPSLVRLQGQLDPQRFALVTITTDLQRQGIRQFLAQLGISLPVLFDEDQETSRSFMVRGLPTTVLVGPDGTLLGRAVGPRTWDSPEAVSSLRQVMGLVK
jgi:thiol-disulfide isomerase/thioredoxin